MCIRDSYLVRDKAHDEELSVQAKWSFRYPDGARDCESIAVDVLSRQVIVIEKVYANRANVYACGLPDLNTNTQQPLVLQRIGRVKVTAPVAMDITADGRRAIVLSYGHAMEYFRGPQETWKDAFGHAGRKIRMPERKQGETICYDHLDNLYLTSERRPTPLYRVAVEKQ